MRMQDYITRYDSLASEDSLFEIPIRKEYILSKIGRGKRVLDVGCLGGKLSRLIMDQKNDVFGVEVNPVAAAVAERRGVRVIVANVEQGLPFDDSYFDVVNAGEVVGYLYDTKFFFEEMKRVLKDQGIILFTAPNLNSIENRLRIFSGGYLNMVGAYPEDHFGKQVRVFNLKKIRELCDQTGLEVTDMSGILNLETHGKWIDSPLFWVGKKFPSFSKLLMVTARKK